VTLSLKEEDVYILQKYANFLSPLVKVNKYFHKKHNKYQYEVKFKSLEIVNHLQSMAEFNNKSYDLYLKTDLNWHILRGIIDGDGGMTFLNNKKTLTISIFSKSKLFLLQINDFLINKGFSPKLTIDKRGLWKLTLYKVEEVLKIGSLLYSDASIFLKRKYMKWLAFLEIRNDKHLKFRETASATLSEINPLFLE
jgi:hypothetical protein